MIPFSTCLCFGKHAFSSWHVVGDNATLRPAGNISDCERRDAVSYDYADKDAVYIRMLGDTKVKCVKRDRGKEDKTGFDLDLDDFDGETIGRGRIGLKFLSLHKVRRKRRPAFKISRTSDSLLDAQYNGQAQFVLMNVGDWGFDMFNLDSLTGGKPLFHLALHLFQEYGFLEYFKLDTMKLMRCLNLVEEGYHENNPYHNVVHAADVTQAMHCYLREQKLSSCVHPMEAMAALFASMMHDLDHPGVNQAYLIATTNILASLYDNSSVLENHHWRSAIGILHESGLFDHFDAHQWGHLEWQLKSLILATDITRQQEFIRKFKEYIDSSDFNLTGNASHRHFTLQIALKCADISNPCRPWKASKRWSERICEEFFLQGDCERKLKLPITPMCDRYTTSIAKIQSGFMEYVVNPLFQEWQRFIPSMLSKDMLKNVSNNKSRWEMERADELQKEAELNEEVQPDSLSSVYELDETNLGNDDDIPKISNTEAEDYNSEGEESDIIGETRFTCMFPSRQNSIEYPDSFRSNSPIYENQENFIPYVRRHSLPVSCFHRDSIRMTVRRESFPHVQRSRRSSTRTNFLHTTSFDGFLSSTKKSTSIESVLARPKITTLSLSSNVSRLASRLVSSDPHLAQQSQTVQSGPKSSSRLTSLLALTAISPPAELDSYPLQAFQSRAVLANLSNNTQVGTSSKEHRQVREPQLNPLRRVSAIDLTFQIKGQSLSSHGEFLNSGRNHTIAEKTDLIPVSNSEPLRLSEHSKRQHSDEESL